jgi:FAD/FMN-containing dehydrogenase
MSAYSLALSRKHHPTLPNPCPGHPGTRCCRSTTVPSTPPAPAQLERALNAALESGVVQDATIAQSGEQARALWALRENIAEAQRRDGPNIKHDISLPVSVIAASSTRRAKRWRRRCPACGS